ncbi:MAG: methyltransferase domain-containing protein [Nitrospiraceae bacterium]|nr:methyltransferase domain-containing protein [Nitrospiraceae bacterium]
MNEKIRAYYRENPLMVSSPFGGVDGVNRNLFDRVFHTLDIELDGRAVLDVGCGRGYAAKVVTERGGSYVGADFVASRPGSPHVLADGARLPFADASFDRVFCIDAFEHFPNAEDAAAEFLRVLCPGGSVFLSVPNYANVAGFVKAYCERWGGYAPDTWAPFRHWQPQELERPLTGGAVRRIFRGVGFRDFRRMGHGAEVSLGMFPWIAHRRMPEAVLFRLQRLFGAVGPAIAKVCPTLSLHQFWRIDSPGAG